MEEPIVEPEQPPAPVPDLAEQLAAVVAAADPLLYPRSLATRLNAATLESSPRAVAAALPLEELKPLLERAAGLFKHEGTLLEVSGNPPMQHNFNP